ncbi:retrovirus-related pol polyprotein from transposon TNT 1-94 [Tanacetum coccineum]
MLVCTEVKQSTSASGSQPSGNTKKDKIQQTQSRIMKNKVEVHPRKVKSILKNKDHVVEPKRTAPVQHSKLNTNFDLKCVKCRPIWSSLYLDSDAPSYDRRSLSAPPLRQQFLGTVKFGNDHVAKIMGYGDYQLGMLQISRVYYVERTLCIIYFSVGQFCGSTSKLRFCQPPATIHNLEGVDFNNGSRGDNLYTLSLEDMMASSPIGLLSKASKTKSWLWHRRLSHLNFGALNHLARHGLVRGSPELSLKRTICVLHVH